MTSQDQMGWAQIVGKWAGPKCIGLAQPADTSQLKRENILL